MVYDLHTHGDLRTSFEVGCMLLVVSEEQQSLESTDSYNCAEKWNCFPLTAYICHFQPPSCL